MREWWSSRNNFRIACTLYTRQWHMFASKMKHEHRNNLGNRSKVVNYVIWWCHGFAEYLVFAIVKEKISNAQLTGADLICAVHSRGFFPSKDRLSASTSCNGFIFLSPHSCDFVEKFAIFGRYSVFRIPTPTIRRLWSIYSPEFTFIHHWESFLRRPPLAQRYENILLWIGSNVLLKLLKCPQRFRSVTFK